MPYDESAPRPNRVNLWEQGVPLGQSWLVFSDERLRAQHKKKRGTSAGSALMSLMIADVFARLTAGELFAWGYRVKPNLSDGPVQIPADLFGKKPDEDAILSDTLTSSGWNYERIRILDPERLASSLALHRADIESTDIAAERNTERKKPGPERSGNELMRIYDQLKAEGKIPATHTTKAAHRAVVDYVESHYPSAFRNGRGLSYKTFARALAQHGRK